MFIGPYPFSEGLMELEFRISEGFDYEVPPDLPRLISRIPLLGPYFCRLGVFALTLVYPGFFDVMTCGVSYVGYALNLKENPASVNEDLFFPT